MLTCLLPLAPLLPFVFPPAAEAPPLPRQDEEAPPEHEWFGSVGAGVTVTSGNSDTSAYHLRADAERRDGPNRYSGDLFYNYGQQEVMGEDETTVDNRGLGLQYDRFVSDRFYWLVNASYFADELADLDARYTLGPGIGYQVKDTEELRWGLETGLSYVWEDFEEGEDAEYLAARIGSDLRWQLNERVRLEQEVDVLPSLEDQDDITVDADTRLVVSLMGSLVANFQYVLHYDNTPANADIERADHRFIATLGWEF